MNDRLTRVLVIKFGPSGDFVLSLPAMRRIREAHPRAWITLLTTPQFEALAKSCPYFNAVEADGEMEGVGDTLSLMGRLRRARYERIYDLQCSPRTNLLFQGLWPSAPPWSGTPPSAKLRHKNPNRERMHVLERQADQLKDAGIWPDAPTAPGTAPAPDLSWILKKAPPQRPVPGASKPRAYALLVPGGSSKAEKRWPLENYIAMANTLRMRGLDIVVLGGPEESAMGRAVQRVVGQARDLTGRTDLAQVAILGSKAAIAIGNQSGAIQLIASAGAPTIALFSGLSDPALEAPRGYVTVLQARSLKDMPVAQVQQAANVLLSSS
ncbi:MAG: glycosyltransferase family 9 protein [Caulobacteraceae bacterium]